MESERVIQNVPDNAISEVVKDFTIEGAWKIIIEKQSDGTWTVSAILSGDK